MAKDTPPTLPNARGSQQRAAEERAAAYQRRREAMRAMSADPEIGPLIRSGEALPGEFASGRPVIRIVAGELPFVVDQIRSALVGSDAPLFQRAGVIVQIAPAEVMTVRGPVEGQRIVPAQIAHIVDCASAAADFEKFDARREEWVRTDCPPRYAEAFAAREGESRLRGLTGLIAAPTPRPDGSIIERPGYDSRTGLFLQTSVAFPAVPLRPSRQAALRALAALEEPLKEFPFVDDFSRSVALSAILTAVGRSAVSAAPIHGVTATAMGSGKSTIVDIASIVATGNPAAVLGQAQREEELEKRVAGALMAGDQVVSIDNCEHPVGLALLCQAATQEIVKLRVLGESRNLDIVCTSALYLTGNNLRIVGDLTRRTLMCSLDPYCERPELRTFAFDPLELARRKRPELLVAALTIFRAHKLAGSPSAGTSVGSFADWCRLVRDPIVWLGRADPCETMSELRKSDPRLAELSAVVEHFEAIFGDRRVQVRGVIDTANQTRFDGIGGDRFANQAFRDALLMVAGDRDTISAKRLGKWLFANQGRVVNGAKRIAQDGSRAGAALWRVELLERP